MFDFEVRFWSLRLDVDLGIKNNVISRISSCDESFAGFWLTKTLQMSESCMLFGAEVAKGGHWAG